MRGIVPSGLALGYGHVVLPVALASTKIRPVHSCDPSQTGIRFDTRYPLRSAERGRRPRGTTLRDARRGERTHRRTFWGGVWGEVRGHHDSRSARRRAVAFWYGAALRSRRAARHGLAFGWNVRARAQDGFFSLPASPASANRASPNRSRWRLPVGAQPWPLGAAGKRVKPRRIGLGSMATWRRP
jgi:hypothetical protein